MNKSHEIVPINILKNGEGYAIIDKEFVGIDTSKIKELISRSDHVKSYLETPFHSIENLFLTIPEIKHHILNYSDKIVQEFTTDYRCISSTYYDKPPGSSWDLMFHQDLSIKLRDPISDSRFHFWKNRGDYYEVQPPIEVLENILIIRIQLDDADLTNGCLKVVPNSHMEGIIDVANYSAENVLNANLKEGDAFLMSPLLLHSSSNNLSGKSRRVIHLEYSSIDLPWFEDYGEK